MRVAIVTDLYDPAALPAFLPEAVRITRAPYTGSFVYELAAAIAASGVEVEVLVPARYFFSVRHPLHAWREMRSLGVVTQPGEVPRRYAFWPCRARLCRPPLDALAVRGEARALGRILDAGERPDLVHAHFAFPVGCAVARAVQSLGLPYVITVHESYLASTWRRCAVGRVLRGALAGAVRLMVPSRAQRETLVSLGPELAARTVEIPNGVDMARFIPRASVREEGAARIAFLGNLLPVKGLEVLLAAVSELRTAGFACDLSIAGGGRLRRELEADARKRKLPVRFLGALERDNVATLLREDTDIFVLPSRTETFGIVLAEALASGVPVVATRCGGPEDIVTDAVGRLVPVGDAKALAGAIRDVWERRKEFVPEQLSSYARGRFSYKTIAVRVMQLYEEVLRGRG